MMELTSHQSDVGAVLEFGNQLISEGLVNEKEENEIREQMISLNDRWEALRMAAMDRQTTYVTRWRSSRNSVVIKIKYTYTVNILIDHSSNGAFHDQ